MKIKPNEREQRNKQIVKDSQTILKSMGYEVKLSHIYEMYAKLSGYQSWNHASAANPEFAEVFKPDPEDSK